MKFLIPDIGTRITLNDDWTFRLYYESRNEALLKSTKIIKTLETQVPKMVYVDKTTKQVVKNWSNNCEWVPDPSGKTEVSKQTDWGGHNPYRSDSYEIVTIPKGSELLVSRIYIRQGLKGYSSVTFSMKKCKANQYTGRFWAKLSDVNEMDVTVHEDTLAAN